METKQVSMWADSPTLDRVMRALLAIAGFNVGMFWLGLGLIRMVDIFNMPLINPANIDPLPALGGAVLVTWTYLGVTRPTVLRYMPPAIVSMPLAAIGLAQVVVGYWERFT